MLDWLFGVTEANRAVSVGYVVGSFIFTAIFIAILAFYKRKRELQIGFVAGILMLVTELILWSTGYRIVESPIHPIIVLFAIGFNPMFYVTSIVYSAINWFMTKSKDFYYKLISAYFVIGYFIFSLVTVLVPMFGEIIIRRLMFNSAYLVYALIVAIFFLLNYKVFGLKKLTKIALIVGVLVNLVIEGVMLLTGIRWYTGSAWLMFPVHVLFELNAGIMLAITLAYKLGFLKTSKKTKSKNVKYF